MDLITPPGVVDGSRCAAFLRTPASVMRSPSTRSPRAHDAVRPCGFCIAGSRITRAAKNSIVKLLPLPCVCQITPALCSKNVLHAGPPPCI